MVVGEVLSEDDVRNRLIQLLWEGPESDLGFAENFESTADYLIAHGVTVSETAPAPSEANIFAVVMGEARNSVANAWTAAASATEDPVSEVAATLPEELCGAIHEPPIPSGGRASRTAWERCVFLKLHGGKHSWQEK